jgi:uncharacterized membrane protein YbhN (UPF0104 family)
VVRTRIISALSFLLLFGVTAALLQRHDTSLHALLRYGSAGLHLAAFGCVALELLGRATRIVLLARGVNASLSLPDAATTQIAADGAAAVTPSRVGADPAKLLVLGRAGIDLPRAGAILVGEALAEALVLALVVIAIALIVGPPGRVALAALSYALSTGLLVLLALRATGPHRKRMLRLLPMPGRWRVRMLPTLRHFTDATGMLQHLPALIKTGIALTTLLHMSARVALLPILCIGTVSSAHLPALTAWAFALLYAGALIPLPSAGGAIEVGFAAALRDLIPPASLIPVLIWWRIYTFYLGALTGTLVLTFTRRSA